jgi:hypothetical protein
MRVTIDGMRSFTDWPRGCSCKIKPVNQLVTLDKSVEAVTLSWTAAVSLLLLSMMPLSVAAQDLEPATGDNIVQDLTNYDNSGECDTIGWSVLLDEINDEDLDFEHYAACHVEINSAAILSCIDPYPYAENSQFTEQDPGEITVVCVVRIFTSGSTPYTLDPVDFYIHTNGGAKYPADTYAMSLWPEDLGALKAQRVEGDADITGSLGFTIPESVSKPFVLAWRVPGFPHLVGLNFVVNRTAPWPP